MMRFCQVLLKCWDLQKLNSLAKFKSALTEFKSDLILKKIILTWSYTSKWQNSSFNKNCTNFLLQYTYYFRKKDFDYFWKFRCFDLSNKSFMLCIWMDFFIISQYLILITGEKCLALFTCYLQQFIKIQIQDFNLSFKNGTERC